MYKEEDDQFNQSSLTLLIVIALVLSALATTAASAAAGACPQDSLGGETCTVNVPEDGNDATPGDGRCEMSPGGGDCSLRAAIQETNAWCKMCQDRVVLPGRAEPYLLTTFLLVDGRLIVRGSAKTEATGNASVIDGNGHDGDGSGNDFGVFAVREGSTLILDGVVVTKGHNHNNGGAIRNFGSVSIRRSWLRENSTHARAGDGGGGAVFNAGVLTILQSTLSGNWSENNDPLRGGGALRNVGGRVSIFDSTLTGNVARGGSGGAISNLKGGSVRLVNTTIAQNHAIRSGGGIDNQTGSAVKAWNSIVATNTLVHGDGTFSTDSDCSGSLGLMGFDLLGSKINSPSDCVAHDLGPGNVVGGSIASERIDPKLNELSDNGGPTPTMALEPGSPAIDAGNPKLDGADACLAEDQRGVPRPADGPNEFFEFDGNPVCDIGAYEFLSPVLLIDNPTVTETEGSLTGLTFMVCLSQVHVEEVSVLFSTQDGTATAGSDYVPRNQFVVFTPGKLCLPIRVRILNDNVHEETEELLAKLSFPRRARITHDGHGTIVDDD